jgi:hypothetical protein
MRSSDYTSLNDGQVALAASTCVWNLVFRNLLKIQSTLAISVLNGLICKGLSHNPTDQKNQDGSTGHDWRQGAHP